VRRGKEENEFEIYRFQNVGKKTGKERRSVDEKAVSLLPVSVAGKEGVKSFLSAKGERASLIRATKHLYDRLFGGERKRKEGQERRELTLV